ncbi:MAG: cobalamin B12-binding domain-containing protein [Rhizomicrobium sp.]
MTMAFDAPSGRYAQKSGHRSREKLERDDCGGGIDWAKGLQGLQFSRRSSELPCSLLTKVIEGEIIPRLFLAHRELQGRSAPQEGPPDVITSDLFAQLVLESEVDEIVEHVQTLMDRGISLDRVFLDLLAPVARKLGVLWEEDQCTFTDVTLGLSRLHRVLHEISRRNTDGRRPHVKRRAFFAPVPGETHTFGVSMLEEFFLHAGWETACDRAPSVASIVQVAATQSLDIIGFSVGCQELLDPLSDLIVKTRKASCNRDVAIMVGGGLFIDNRDLAARFGNATIVADSVHAVQIAEEMVSRVRYSGDAGKLG